MYALPIELLEEIIDWIVGPRGKLEVGEEAVANFVRTVYGGDAMDDLEQRISRSLGIAQTGAPAQSSDRGR